MFGGMPLGTIGSNPKMEHPSFYLLPVVFVELFWYLGCGREMAGCVPVRACACVYITE